MELNAHPGAFGALPEEFCQYETAEIAVMPIPYDGTSTWGKGANLGPRSLLEASAHLELYDIETESEVFRRGIVTVAPISCPEGPEAMVAQVGKRAKELLQDGKFVVGIGGEHSVSVGLIRATAERSKGMCVLQLDAHADTRDEYEGSRYSHACVMARVSEICPYVQVGIRSMDASELRNLVPKRTFFAHQIKKVTDTIPRILSSLSSEVYVTIDLDVFDPSVMPATGTPEPGGLDWYTTIEILDSVIAHKRVVGMDVTELSPISGNRAPNFVAAKLVYRVLSRIFLGRESCNG